VSNNPTYRNVKPESKAREDQQRQHAIEGRASFAADPREVAHLSTHSKTDPKLVTVPRFERFMKGTAEKA